MDLQLQDKHVLITGGSKGIGLACAQAFLAEGARVSLVSRSAGPIRTVQLAPELCGISRPSPGATNDEDQQRSHPHHTRG